MSEDEDDDEDENSKSSDLLEIDSLYEEGGEFSAYTRGCGCCSYETEVTSEKAIVYVALCRERLARAEKLAEKLIREENAD